MWATGNSSDSLNLGLNDEDGSAIANIFGALAVAPYSLDSRYTIRGFNPKSKMYYFLTVANGGVFSNQATIDGFDIYFTDKGTKIGD